MTVHLNGGSCITIHPLKSLLKTCTETVGCKYGEQIRVCYIVKDPLKYSDNRHVDPLVNSAFAMVSRIAAMALNMLLSRIPQCWLG
jgi:hypothetical protein